MHVEHFPAMQNSQLVTQYGVTVLNGEDINGIKLSFGNLIFHGGIGATLEYRVFSEDSLVNCLSSAGFSNLRKNRDSKLLGVFWEPWSRVWVGVRKNSN